jgi:hypothetical protein
MSHHALQRVVVRMLYDPSLVERVHADGRAALDDIDLTDEEIAWLRAVDRRAFGTDPLRRSRSLTDLLAEFPVAGALARDVAGVPALDAFFSSSCFHEGRQRGRSLAADFGIHLEALGRNHAAAAPWLLPLARLEATLARIRRASDRPGSPGLWSLHPRCALLDPPRHALAAHQAVRGRLEDHGTDPVAAVLEPACRAGLRLPDPGPGPEFLLLCVDDAGAARLELLSEELFRILDAARAGTTRAALREVCRGLGAAEDQIDPILDGFVESGELIPGS